MTCCDNDVRDPYELFQGETRKLAPPLTVLSPDTGDPIDITGSKLYLTIRARIENVDYLISKRNLAAGGSDAEILIRAQTGTNIGKADVFFVPADTANIQPGTYWMDAWVVLSTGEHYPVIQTRKFIIRASVTRNI